MNDLSADDAALSDLVLRCLSATCSALAGSAVYVPAPRPRRRGERGPDRQPRRVGRPRASVTDSAIRAAHARGLSIRGIGKEVGLSYGTIGLRLRELGLQANGTWRGTPPSKEP